jgi:NADH dehydrogenase
MILITGSSGFIGRVLGRALAHAGHEWRPYSGRMNSPQTLRAELEGVDTVIHLAGAEARGSNRLLQQVDVDGTQRLLEAARRAGVSRFIYPSRLNANPHSMHALLRVKGEVERLVRQSGIPYTILRTSTLFGRDDRYSELIFSLALWTWPLAWLPGGGKMAMQPLWVEDYVHCLIQALDRSDTINQTLTVAGNELISYRDFVRTILNVTGKRRLLMPLPMTLMRPVTRVLLGWWYWPAISRYFVDRFFVPDVTDLDVVQRQFGFHPARFGETITYLNRPGLRWRLFRH